MKLLFVVIALSAAFAYAENAEGMYVQFRLGNNFP